MIGDHSALDLILQASLIVQFVMALLVGASVVSWAIIFRKRPAAEDRARGRRSASRSSSGPAATSSGLYKSLEAGSPTGMAGVFVAGFREFSRLRKQAGIGAARAARGQPAGDAGRAVARDRPPRAEPLDARDHRLDEPVRGPVRHRVGHHECVPGARQRAAGDARDGRARHRRGPDRHRDGPVRGDSGRHRLQPLRRPGRDASSCVTTRSWRSSRPSCSVTPACRAEPWRRSHAVAARATADGRDQRRPLHRRHAGAADHLHGDGADAEPGHQGGPAEGGGGAAASGRRAAGAQHRRGGRHVPQHRRSPGARSTPDRVLELGLGRAAPGT